MYDIIFCELPYSNLDNVYSAPAILKGVVIANGYTARTINFGQTLLNLCNKDVHLLNKVQNYFVSPGNTLNSQESDILNQLYDEIINFFKENKSRFIGISIFSVDTHKAVFDLTTLFKKHYIESEIVVGGRGAKVPLYDVISKDIGTSGIDRLLPMGEMLQKKKLVDHVIIGDGEDSILTVLQKDLRSSEGEQEIFNYPLPNYDDYIWEDYLMHDIWMPITGSKGCVRNCDFCDIRFQFGKYKYRSGKDIAEEMLFVSEKFNRRKFVFTDSLINGGLKPLEEFCTIIADHNIKNPDKKFTWTGQYICRPETQIPKRLYQLMADSGAEGLTIGAESGSNHVLTMMDKKTTVEALYSELEQFRQHKLTCNLLTFVGHWSETFDDFVDHCNMIVNILPYVRSGTISAVTLGHPFEIYHGTPASDKISEHKIHISTNSMANIWASELNPTNTFKERVYRKLIVHKLALKFKIPLFDEFNYLRRMNTVVEQEYSVINDFYEGFSKNAIY